MEAFARKDLLTPFFARMIWVTIHWHDKFVDVGVCHIGSWITHE
jgi:hypothetical protein